MPSMRPLRLLLSLATSLITVTLLLYLVFGSQHEDLQTGAAPAQEKPLLKSFFSFTSPASLFPPSAIISLTDDNSTFFLARPAAFGPALPSSSLSGPLWAGSGFGDEAMSKGGELGCSDIPDWNGPDALSTSSDLNHASKKSPLKEQPHGAVHVAERSITDVDGTDDHLHPPVSLPRPSTYRVGKLPEHADIESLQQTAEIAGKIVLLKRGGCGFLDKVMWAQNRGAVALIVGDDQRGGALVRMYARGDTSNVTIPALFTSHTTAHLLSSLLPSEGFFNHVSPGGIIKPTSTKSEQADSTLARKTKSTPIKSKGSLKPAMASSLAREQSASPQRAGWLASILASHRVKDSGGVALEDATRRPPISGQINWTSAAEGRVGHVNSKSEHPENSSKKTTGWFDQSLDGDKGSSAQNDGGKDQQLTSTVKPSDKGHSNNSHEGLWVTLTPTNMSTSPFFDTLLVLVVSPLVTLTIVYALLLLRSRIRRRRWRAPKSLVDRLPVRTYQTISDSSPSATPISSSPTTPLLQHESPRPSSSLPRPRSRAESEEPATSSSVQQNHRTPEEEKRESGLAAWRRKYGGRQKECVVCLEEYVDGISRVMSLPCGHEFHADCM